MSKKMMKRSLALGALMAFVITGSAMAADDSNNDVVVDASQTVLDVYGGNSVDGSANYNKVTVDGAVVTGLIRGGHAYTDAIGNEVTVNASEVTGSVKGGSAQDHEEDNIAGIAKDNKVTIMGETVVHGSVYGAENLGFGIENGNVSNNEVTIIDSTVDKDVSGGVSHWAGYSITGNSDVIGNKVTVENSEVKQWISGGHASFSNANKNELIIDGSVIGDNVYGGRAQADGSAKENIVKITDSTVTGNVYGGSAVDSYEYRAVELAEANKNTVTIENTTVSGTVYGGYSKLDKNGLDSVTNENSVTIAGGAVVDVYGGKSESGSANNNKVTVDGAVVTGLIRGGHAYTDAIGNEVTVNASEVTGSVKGGSAQDHEEDNIAGIAKDNKVTIMGETVVHGSVYGAENLGFGIENGNVSNNEVTIIDSTVDKDVSGGVSHWAGYSITGNSDVIGNKVTVENSEVKQWISGGHASFSNANKNELIIDGSVIGDNVYGGRAQADGSAKENIVKITDSTVTGNVYGGSAVDSYEYRAVELAEANKNTVTIENTTVSGTVYGGYSKLDKTGLESVANENTVTITGGVINKDVYGGYAGTEANDNTVNISGSANLTNASLFGSNLTTSTGNTLNIGEGWTGTAKSVQNFNTVNFAKGSAIKVTNGMTLADGATLNLADGNDYTEKYAIAGKLTTGETATLTIGNIKQTTYNIASVYDSDTEWTLDNGLMEVKKDESGNVVGWETSGEDFKVTVQAKSASDIANNLGVSEDTGNMIANIVSNASSVKEGTPEAAVVDFINNVMNNVEDKGAAINSAQKMAEAGGNNATAANIVKNVTGVTNDRLSFNCGHSAPHKGGHGVGLLEEGSGADIWVEYVHGKDKVEDMPSSAGATSYEGQFNGIVMGVDFKKVNKFQSGVAFNYGEGDTNSVGSVARTHSDYDFWGIGYYGNIHNDDSNVLFDINFAKTDSDVTQNNSGTTFEASPETTTWSAGVKLEKLYQNENVQIVPYTGLRYMSIDSDDYSTKCGAFSYSMDRQDIWLLPLGVSIKQEVANDNGWTVSPRVDLSYIWAFGDTNSNMEVKTPFAGVSQLGYDVMDDGSFLGLVGIEAHKGQWGYGVSYSYQKGDHSESKKWYVDVNYSF